ncbi:unnamed protein product [Rotaria sp. Silwood1]|nr:unnamed protein product [Rotaria sp. Silwood1]
MSVDLHLRIEIVVMMAKLQFPSLVKRHFQNDNVQHIPTEKTIKAIYDTFLEIGLVRDRERSGRPSVTTSKKLDESAEVLSNNSVGYHLPQIRFPEFIPK